LSRNASLGVHGYILVFSLVSRNSFERIDQVNDSLLNTLGDAPDVPRVLVGSMKDLEDQRQVSQQVRLDSDARLPAFRPVAHMSEYLFLSTLSAAGRAEACRLMGHPLH